MFMATLSNARVGVSVSIAIGLHNILEGYRARHTRPATRCVH